MYIFLVLLLLYFLSQVLKFKTTKKLLLSWFIISFFLMFLGENSLSHFSIFHACTFLFGFVFTILGKFLFLIILIYFLVWK